MYNMLKVSFEIYEMTHCYLDMLVSLIAALGYTPDNQLWFC